MTEAQLTLDEIAKLVEVTENWGYQSTNVFSFYEGYVDDNIKINVYDPENSGLLSKGLFKIKVVSNALFEYVAAYSGDNPEIRGIYTAAKEKYKVAEQKRKEKRKTTQEPTKDDTIKKIRDILTRSAIEKG